MGLLLDGGRKAGGDNTSRVGGGKERERLEFLPPDAASLRSSEPSSYVYRALRRGGMAQHCQGLGSLFGVGKALGRESDTRGDRQGRTGQGGGKLWLLVSHDKARHHFR